LHSVDSIRLVLPDDHPAALVEYRTYLHAAQTHLRTFAKKYRWEQYLEDPFITEMRVFNQKTAFDRAMIDHFSLELESLPETYCAALEDKILFIVTPELYSKVYPEGREPSFYEKLITHELAHRFHIRLLAGDEEAMGPRWFYEGFATFVADQFAVRNYSLKEDEVRQLLLEETSGTYLQFNALFELVLTKVPLVQLILKAKEQNFSHWVLGLLE
jgi:hypothetical protein